MNQNELQHWGIKGMKWGVRRYQNKDGSLTPAGKKRAAKLKNQYTELTGKRLIRKPTSKNKEPTNTKKSVKEISDTELREHMNRLQMEKQVKNLESDLAPKGQKFISTIGKQVVAPAAMEAGKRLLTDSLMKIGKEKLGLNPETTKDGLEGLRKEVDELELKKRKTVAQDYFKKRKEKNSSSKSNKSKSKAEEVNSEFIRNDTSNKSYKNRESTIIDADWEDVSTDSTAIVPYVRSGESYVDELFRRNR